MTRFGHDRLPTFGAGTELDRRTWQSVVRQLVAAGYLSVDVDGFGGLRLAGEAAALLKGERTIELRRELPTPRGTRERKRRETIAIEDAGDRSLFEALRAKRMELARAQGVPPFVIFADRSLIEMATKRPTSLAELAEVHGVGQAKLARYGETFLGILAGGATPKRQSDPERQSEPERHSMPERHYEQDRDSSPEPHYELDEPEDTFDD
jgi:ATP-dependent DNA helicase RecQ